MKLEPSTPRWWDLPAAALLMVALVTAATRLVVTDWTQYLSIVQTVVFIAVIAGFALGQSRFSPNLATFFALCYGAFVIPWQLGITLNQDVEWRVRLFNIVDRLTIIITQLMAQEVVQDSLLFIVLMAVLFWILGVQAGYTLVRYGNPWQAILPSGLALFAIHSFDALVPRRAWFLAIYLFFALVLVARMAYLHHHIRWQQSRTALPPHLGLDFIRFTLLATAVLVIFSWTAPALANTVPVAERAFQKIKQPYNEMRDKMDNAFASLRSSVGVVSDYYGSSVLLGRGNRLTDTQVFRVTPVGTIPAGVRLYWRAKAFDTYNDGQWFNTISTSQPFSPNDGVLAIPQEEGRYPSLFEFTSNTYISTLFSPPQPVWVNLPAQTESAANPDGTLDVTAMRATPSLTPGQTYQVQATLANATIAEMRAAGTNYPKHILDRYLQLPSSITPRTRELAQQITTGLDNPYDKAVAITNYLRRNITYTEIIPGQPGGQEAVDWFLFDLKQGFCNYYSSAEIVLLRAVGIPARWAVGYAQGERLEDGSYLVRQRDAHAWPEVYFPTLGWVEFEPTASQPLIDRLPGDPNEALNPEIAGSGLDEDLERRQLEEELRAQREDRELGTATPSSATSPQDIGTALSIAGSVLILGFFLWRFLRMQYGLPALPILLERLFTRLGLRPPRRLHLWAEKAAQAPPLRPILPAFPILMESILLRLGLRPPSALRLWARRAALPPLSKAYLEINGALTRLGQRPTAAQTPSERASQLTQIIPEALTPAQQLAYQYQRATFGPDSQQTASDLPTARKAGSEVRKLSYLAILKRLLARIQQPQRPTRSWPRNGKT